MDKQETVTLEYIFPRPTMQDPFDGSFWAAGEVRKLAKRHADRLLKHPDCWAVSTKKAKLHESLKRDDLDEEEIEEDEDIDIEGDTPNLDVMTKDQIARLAKTRFNFDMDSGKQTKAQMMLQVRNLLATRGH